MTIPALKRDPAVSRGIAVLSLGRGRDVHRTKLGPRTKGCRTNAINRPQLYHRTIPALMYDTSHGSRHGSAGAKLLEDTTALNWAPALIGTTIMAASLSCQAACSYVRNLARLTAWQPRNKSTWKSRKTFKARKIEGKKMSRQENPRKEKKLKAKKYFNARTCQGLK